MCIMGGGHQQSITACEEPLRKTCTAAPGNCQTTTGRPPIPPTTQPQPQPQQSPQPGCNGPELPPTPPSTPPQPQPRQSTQSDCDGPELQGDNVHRLSFNPWKWDLHQAIILNHFKAKPFCAGILNGQITPPIMDITAAIAQLRLATMINHFQDDATNKTAPFTDDLAGYKNAAPHVQRILYNQADSILYEFFCKYLSAVPSESQPCYKYLAPAQAHRERSGLLIFQKLQAMGNNHRRRKLNKAARAHTKPSSRRALYQPQDKEIPKGIPKRSQGNYDRQPQRGTKSRSLSSYENYEKRCPPTKGRRLRAAGFISNGHMFYTKSAQLHRRNQVPVFNQHRLMSERALRRHKLRGSTKPQKRKGPGTSRSHGSLKAMTKAAALKNVYLCRWCKKYRPGKQTNHSSQDCRIKADHLQTVCDICSQKGHPTRFCPQKAHQAHVASSRRARSPRTKPKGESYSRALTAKDARVHLRHLESLSTGQANCKYRIVECKASDSL